MRVEGSAGDLTRRSTVPELEARMGEAIRVLDHGFVRVVDYMGGDDAIVQAARVSYGKGTRSARDDRGLIRYLMRARHSTPFEMCELKLHVRLPIFVARQWIRHRTASVNEVSARYSILDREFYLPGPEDLAAQATVNRQGRGEPLTAEESAHVLAVLRRESEASYATYEDLLNDAGDGTPVAPDRPQLARELARMALTLNHYTQWYWKIDLHNLFHFLSLRADPHAQLEMRRYAEAILDLCRSWVPTATEAFEDYRLGARSLSRLDLDVVRRLLRGEAPDQAFAGSDLTQREQRELRALLELP